MSISFSGSFLIRPVFVGMLLWVAAPVLYGQDRLSEDLALVSRQTFSTPDEFAHYHGTGNNDKILQSKHHNIVAEYNPLSLFLKGALLGYQKIVSQQLARQCPYEISCSNFSKQAIQEFGVFKGVFIGADRILRCNRIGLEDVSPLNIDPANGFIIDSPNMYR